MCKVRLTHISIRGSSDGPWIWHVEGHNKAQEISEADPAVAYPIYS